jgi:CRISPR locus-related DNA-binding protein
VACHPSPQRVGLRLILATARGGAHIKLLGEKGLGPRDVIVVVTPPQDHLRTDSALKSIREFIEKINPRANLIREKLSDTNVLESAIQLSKKILQYRQQGYMVIVDISGGAKGLSLSLFIAASVSGADEIYLASEVTGERVQLPRIPEPQKLTRRQLQVLAILPATLRETAERLGVSKTAASRLLNRMRANGIVILEKDKYYPTAWGSLLKNINEK